jgi:hypothetical protein
MRLSAGTDRVSSKNYRKMSAAEQERLDTQMTLRAKEGLADPAYRAELDEIAKLFGDWTNEAVQ